MTGENSPYDLDTYSGRLLHFLRQQNPLNVLCTSAELENAKKIISTKLEKDEEYWDAKYIYSSAYHPTTDEKIFLPGRMCFQAPGNTFLCYGMLTFYKTPIQAFIAQFANQSFNSTVNYANSPQPVFKPVDFFVAAGSACTLAVVLNRMTARSKSELVKKLMPFGVVCLANMTNLPYMRRSELFDEGIPLYDENGEQVASSTRVGREAVSKVVASRILMASGSMVFPPIVLNYLQQNGRLLARKPKLRTPVEVCLIAIAITFATPAMCAIWPQTMRVPVENLEEETRDRLLSQNIKTVQCNKGL